MRKVFLLTSILIGLTSVALGNPRPMAISGTFDETGLIKVFGEGFGDYHGEEMASRDSNFPDTFCVLVGDHPDLARCTFQKKMEVEKWTPSEIQFHLSEDSLSELEEFYFFVIDGEGEASWGAGPWLLGMGILESTGQRINLEAAGDHLVPAGVFPGAIGESELGPGAPTGVWLSGPD